MFVKGYFEFPDINNARLFAYSLMKFGLSSEVDANRVYIFQEKEPFEFPRGKAESLKEEAEKLGGRGELYAYSVVVIYDIYAGRDKRDESEKAKFITGAIGD